MGYPVVSVNRIEGGKVNNLTQNEEYDFAPIPEFAMDMINAGGLMNYIKQEAK